MSECRPLQSHRRGWSAPSAAVIAVAMIASASVVHGEQQAMQFDPSGRDHGQMAYHYKIEHARYGDIGTYVNVVTHKGNDTEVDSEMHVAVRMLGIVMFREDARRTEYWRDGRFIAFRGVTVTNGEKLEVSGEAQGGNFVVTTADGRIVAPGNVHPSNPWSTMVLDTDAVMSTKTGEVFKARVIGGEIERVTFDGDARPLRRYEIDDDKQEFVWFDDRGVPAAFRVFEDGSSIDFVLTH